MSKLTSDQILLSASQSMLSQANQLPRNVLQLLESE
ncbi:MAG: flagellin, partial [SAR324 cluster bacterium]|nr:flagellin [SAR324 cluster bacterium]